MFSKYLYTSSTSSSFRNHFIDAANKYTKQLKLKSNKSYIIDIGSNDGVALKPFKDAGFKKIQGINLFFIHPSSEKDFNILKPFI